MSGGEETQSTDDDQHFASGHIGRPTHMAEYGASIRESDSEKGEHHGEEG